MELKLKHIAPYLPYKLKIVYRVLDLENGNPNTGNPDDRMKNCIMVMTGARLDNCLLDKNDRWYTKGSVFKPILRPLSDLHDTSLKWKEVASEEAVSNSDDFLINGSGIINNISYSFSKFLLKNHFDVFNLIPLGLAIDINTLP